VPHTPEWFDYWAVRLDNLMDGEQVDEKMPVEFLDALMTRADAAAGLNTPGSSRPCIATDNWY